MWGLTNNFCIQLGSVNQASATQELSIIPQILQLVFLSILLVQSCLQIYCEPTALNKKAQWGNREGCLEDKEPTPMGNGCVHIWFSNQCICSLVWVGLATSSRISGCEASSCNI